MATVPSVKVDCRFVLLLLDYACDDLSIQTSVARGDVLPKRAGDLGLENSPVVFYETSQPTSPKVYGCWGAIRRGRPYEDAR